jgi:hypothetical protein
LSIKRSPKTQVVATETAEVAHSVVRIAADPVGDAIEENLLERVGTFGHLEQIRGPSLYFEIYGPSIFQMLCPMVDGASQEVTFLRTWGLAFRAQGSYVRSCTKASRTYSALAARG